jgi:hypothetical protein
VLTRLGFLAVLIAAAWAAVPASARAEEGSRLVTIVARECDTFAEITGNRARNNIQETLVPLGADSPYGNPAFSPAIPNIVSPEVESRFQPACRPLDNWEFTLGGNYASPPNAAHDPSFGSLSIVKDPIYRTLTTLPTTPLLNEQGAETGEQIQGAVTITLTDEEIKQLNLGANKLWLQGGTPANPITDKANYGFAALRCATDNLNGDNVEWIAYPPSTRHVFCYGYYVRPRPNPAAKIVIKKVLKPDNAPPTVFQFESDASFTADNLFTLAPSGGHPAEASFERESGRTWTFEELVPALGNPDPKPTCVSKNGGSSYTVDPSNPAKVSVLLGAGDTVTCTFTNSPATTLSGLFIRKVSLGGVGTFDYTVKHGTDTVDTPSVTTTEPSVPAPKRVDNVDPGKTYTIEEHLPESDVGDWALEAVTCTGGHQEFPLGKATVPAAGSAFCTFRNRFTPVGRIRIYKRTLGGTGTANFQIRPVKVSGKQYVDDLAGKEFQQIATTKEPGVSVLARPHRGEQDSTEKIDVGTYAIQETTSVPGDGGVWTVVAIDCDQTPVWSEQGRVVVQLTADDPHISCRFTNQLDKTPTPPLPTPTPPSRPAPPETPQGGVLGEMALATPRAELRVRKTVVPRRIRLGHIARYRVVVRNRGPATAKSVVVQEQGRSAARGALKLRTSKGSCHRSPPRFCKVGNLKRGQHATITVTVRPTRTGRFPNVVAVHTSTRQRTSRRKRARAALTVVPAASPRFTG